jgi:hypothetical protein
VEEAGSRVADRSRIGVADRASHMDRARPGAGHGVHECSVRLGAAPLRPCLADLLDDGESEGDGVVEVVGDGQHHVPGPDVVVPPDVGAASHHSLTTSIRSGELHVRVACACTHLRQ